MAVIEKKKHTAEAKRKKDRCRGQVPFRKSSKSVTATTERKTSLVERR